MQGLLQEEYVFLRVALQRLVVIVRISLARLFSMDKLIAAFLEDRQIFLLVFLFTVMLGVCLHLHGDKTLVGDVHLTALTQWAREATAGILAAILIKINSGTKGEGK